MKKILIIEDDQKIAFGLCVRLKAHGYATWVAEDGIRGMGLALRILPDLILLDISLPAGNGFALADQLNKFPETQLTPVFYIYMDALQRKFAGLRKLFSFRRAQPSEVAA